MFLNIASNGVTYIGGEIVFKNMIIHQQSIIGFNISSIKGSNTNNKNRFLDEGLMALTNQMKDFPNKLKYKNFERIKPYFNYFGLRSLNISNYTLSDDSMSKIKKRNLFQI